MAGKPIYLFKQFAKEEYGEPLFRVPLDLGFGCPNRDSNGRGGCTFCPPDGGRAAQLADSEKISNQIERGISFARRRYGARKFMAYLQAYTNTFQNLERQRRIYRQILDAHPFEAISIGTRPDCLSPQVLEMLSEINRETEVWIDLGVQTIHNNTLQSIQRGHDWETSRQAILNSANAGLRTAVHVIIGLPGERPSHFRQTIESLASLPIHGVKFHNLHILKDTPLADEYQRNPFPVYKEYEYGEILIDMLRRTPQKLPVMRMMTDSEPEQIIAPRWVMKKGQFQEYIQRQMILREYSQGDLIDSKQKPEDRQSLQMEPKETDDSSITFYNPEFNEHYHTPVGARSEAQRKYIAPSRLAERIRENDVRLLDICFGLGYNSLVAAETVLSNHPENKLSITALEIDRRAVGLAARHIQNHPHNRLNWKECLQALYTDGCYRKSNLEIRILWGDARHTIRKLDAASYDLVFLDAFSTQRNSQLWTLDFFRQIRKTMRNDAVLCTYCAALPVRGGLREAGFHIGESSPFGRQRSGTVASLQSNPIERTISAEELRKISTTSRGLPYRDPRLVWSNSKILRQREKARELSSGAELP